MIEWTKVKDEEPEPNKLVVAKSPDGACHICHWRDGYEIFTCQCKGEYAGDWEWSYLENDSGDNMETYCVTVTYPCEVEQNAEVDWVTVEAGSEEMAMKKAKLEARHKIKTFIRKDF